MSSRGRIPGLILDERVHKKRRVSGDPKERTKACVHYVKNHEVYESVVDFVSCYIPSDGKSTWRPSRSQMSRDMISIFGRDWRMKIKNQTIMIPTVPEDCLEPSHRPTILSAGMEKRIIHSLSQFENRFGTGIVTPLLIESVASYEVLAQLPELHVTGDIASLWKSNDVQNRINVVLRQISSVSKEGWMRSFLKRHKTEIRRSIHRRALERHKAAKHQIELVLTHLRNMYQAEALAQIQRKMAAEDVDVETLRR